MSKESLSKKLTLITLSLIFIFFFLPLKEANAGSSDNISGWAWSENIGWISFNSTNCDSNNDGLTDKGNFNQCPSGNPVVSYGVNIDLAGAKDFSGYAWSENIGWISFEPASVSGCPPGGPCRANLSGSNKISGWARACAVFASGCSGPLSPNRGGWEGWIHFKEGGKYGVYIGADNEFKDWAWGGYDVDPKTAVIGWVNFNSESCDSDSNGFSDGGTGCPPAGTSVPDYKVIFSGVTAAAKPSAINLRADSDNPADYCPSTSRPPVRLQWDFTDPNPGDTQSAYQIQISLNSGFSNIIEDTFKVSNSGGAYTAGNLNYGGVTYYWRLKVWDDKNNESDWITGPSFVTISYPYPSPNFDWDPKKITTKDPVTFTDLTNFYSNPGVKSWKWDMDNDGTTDYTTQNVVGHLYSEVNPSGYVVKLEVTVGGKTCSISKPSVSVFFAPPTWIETRPPTK